MLYLRVRLKYDYNKFLKNNNKKNIFCSQKFIQNFKILYRARSLGVHHLFSLIKLFRNIHYFL